MKRMLCIALAGLIWLCGCTGQPSEPSGSTAATLPTSPPVIVPIAERTEAGVEVTIHGGLLGANAEVLSDEQKASGFTHAVRNGDGSVTYTIAAESYDAFVQAKLADTRKAIDETVRGNFASVTGVSYADDLSQITLTVIRDSYEYSVDALAVFALGTLAITAQAYNIDAPGICVITVLDENGDEVSRTVYPDELIL